MTLDPNQLADASATADQLAGSMDRLTNLSQAFGTALNTALKQAVVQGRQLDTVLRGLALNVVSASLNSALQPLVQTVGGQIDGGLSSLIAGLGASAAGFRDGGVFQAGRVQPFAAGGIVSSPTYFPMAGGSTGLMGEAGAEAIMPLTRGPDGRLGVAAAGSGQAVQIHFNVTTPDTAGFARSEAQMTSLLARAVGRGRRGL